MINAKTASIGFGVTFVLAGIAGFVPNPVVSSDGIFVVDTTHSLLHILTGAAFLAGGLLLKGAERATIRVLGVVGLALAVLGFMTSGDMLLGMIHINQADRWLHAFLAAGILATGLGVPKVPTKVPE